MGDSRQVARPRRRSEAAHAPAEQRPGAPVVPSDLAVNELVQALDPKSGLWHNAKVLGVVGEGPRASAKVTFVGFGASQNVSYKKDNHALRRRISNADLKREQEAAIWGGSTTGQLSGGLWSVEKILAKRTSKRRTEYLVRWSGWSPDHDSWEREVDAEMVAEYEMELQRATRRAGRPAAPPKPPAVPFSPALCAGEAAAIQEQRVIDAGELLAHVGAEGAERVRRQKLPVAEARVVNIKSAIAAGLFCAMRQRLAGEAAAAQPGRDVDLAVTPVSSHRRGARPVDTFSVMDDDLVNTIVGDGVLHIAPTNGSAIKMVAPLDFYLKARRDDAGALLPTKEFTATAHVVALVANLDDPSQPRFRCDDASFAYPTTDRHAYKQAVAARLLLEAQAGQHVPAEYLAWAQAL